MNLSFRIAAGISTAGSGSARTAAAVPKIISVVVGSLCLQVEIVGDNTAVEVPAVVVYAYL